MKIQVTTKEFDKGIIVSPSGRINASNAHVLEEVLRGLLDDGQKAFVFDLTRLRAITSSGLRVLLMASRDAKNLGGSSVVCGLNEDLKEVFAVSGFDKLLPIHNSREEALDAF